MARDGGPARRHRGARLRDPAAPARVGGLGPPRRLHRSAGGLQDLRAALPRRPPGRSAMRAQALQAPGRDRRVQPDRGARLQPDVRDDDRPGEGVWLSRLSAPGDRAGDLHQLQERAAVLAQEAAVRDRAGGQVVSQRDHARQLHLPHTRVRADGDGVLHAAGRGAEVVRALALRANELVHHARLAPRPSAPARARSRRALALLLGHERRGVPVPDRLVGARGDRQPWQLRPHTARGVLRRETGVLRSCRPTSAIYPT